LTGELKVQVYEATKVVISNTDDDDKKNGKISDYIEIEFNKVVDSRTEGDTNTVSDSSEPGWFYNSADGYFYYNKVLPSGATTVPLIKAVRMKNSVGNELINAKYELTVNNDSTQANDDAALAMFKIEGFGDTMLNAYTNIIQTGTGTAVCEQSNAADTLSVCSESTSEAVVAFNAQRGTKTWANSTSTNTTPTTTTTVAASESSSVN
jgi:hypothetical protein